MWVIGVDWLRLCWTSGFLGSVVEWGWVGRCPINLLSLWSSLHFPSSPLPSNWNYSSTLELSVWFFNLGGLLCRFVGFRFRPCLYRTPVYRGDIISLLHACSNVLERWKFASPQRSWPCSDPLGCWGFLRAARCEGYKQSLSCINICFVCFVWDYSIQFVTHHLRLKSQAAWNITKSILQHFGITGCLNWAPFFIVWLQNINIVSSQ